MFLLLLFYGYQEFEMILLSFVVLILLCLLLVAMLKNNILATALIALWLGFGATILAQSFDKL